ncbi:MAG TPA: hypothetical protein ENJ50_10390, partial [Planctomycetaceae bacterium]|nr:hypothetical protein [Planctomycetaceae bacterium]
MTADVSAEDSREDSTSQAATIGERETESVAESGDGPPRRKARRARGGAGRKRTVTKDREPDQAASESAQVDPEGDPGGERSDKKRTKRTRGGRGRRSTSSTSEPSESSDSATQQGNLGEEDGGGNPPAAKPRKSRTRRKVLTRRKRSAAVEAKLEGPLEAESRAVEEAQASDGSDSDRNELKKRRRRGSRGGRRRKKAEVAHGVVESIPGEENELLDLEEFERALSGTGSRRTSKAGSARAKQSHQESIEERARVSAEKAAALEAARTQTILVNADHHEEVRVAVCEGERILDFQMVVDRYTSLVNDIYRGRVVNLEAPIGAAFVDFGQGKNGFLHASDVLSAYGDPDWSLDK